MTDRKDRSPHILNTSSNLLGLCFIVLTSGRILDMKESSFIDELTGFAIILFMFSSVLSYLSMKTADGRGERYEKIADVIFLGGLFFLVAITVLITLNINIGVHK